MKRLIGVLCAINVIQICNILPLAVDPKPEFLLGLVVNLIIGAVSLPTAYTIWAGRKHSQMAGIALAVFALGSAAYFEYVIVIHFGEVFLSPPLTVSLIMIAVNIILIPMLRYLL